MKNVKLAQIFQKTVYVLTCFLLSFSLSGCREKGGLITVLDGLPESAYLTEAKAALDSGKPIAVAFTAEWCPHCRHYKPTFFEVKSSFEDKVSFINIDVDDSTASALSSRFQVKGIPTSVFVRADGSIFKVHVGGLEKEDLTKIIDDLLASRKRKRGEPLAPFPIELKQEVKAPEEQNQEEVKPAEKKDEAPQELIKEDKGATEEIKDEGIKNETIEEQQESIPEIKPEAKEEIKELVPENSPEPENIKPE